MQIEADRIGSFMEGRVTVICGDITRQGVGVIVNAANSSLLGGGGVDGAIHSVGGPEILAACQEIRRTQYPKGLPTGEAVITTGGRLPARFVIHTVGPVKGVHGEKDSVLLASCYQRSLELAREHGLTSIAFPAISTGIYGYPREEAAAIASAAVAKFLATDSTITDIRLVFFTRGDAEVFLANQRFPSGGSVPVVPPQ
jgi:O-acetyl-ADP-ribose deacetylase (regulator of RNase III)